MAQLVVLVLDDPEKIDQVLDVWVSAGVTGATILNSMGLGRQMGKRNRDDLPLFPTLESLLRSTEESHRTLFAVVPDEFDVPGLVAATEKLTGQLREPDTGVLFVVPVTRVWGLQRG